MARSATLQQLHMLLTSRIGQAGCRASAIPLLNQWQSKSPSAGGWQQAHTHIHHLAASCQHVLSEPTSNIHRAPHSWQPHQHCLPFTSCFSTSSQPGGDQKGSPASQGAGQDATSSKPEAEVPQTSGGGGGDAGGPGPAADQPSSSGNMLSRIRHILPGLFNRSGLSRFMGAPQPSPSQPPASSSGPGDNQTSTPRSKQTDQEKALQETLEQYENLAKMDLNEHRSLLSSELTQQPEPVPQLPPVPMWHAHYQDFLDEKRVVYLQTKQHIAILECLTDEQKQKIESEGRAVLRNKQLLGEIAEATKQRGTEYMELEVRDCLSTFFSSKERGRRMLVWVRDLQHPPPESIEKARQAEQAIKLLEARDWLMERMGYSVGPAACSLHRVRGWAGAGARCEHTGLPYSFCCGGKPIPAKLAQVFMDADEEGVSYDSREFKKRLQAVTPVNRFTRRGKPLNHLLPPREGQPRLENHERLMRQSSRMQLEPKFDKDTAKP